MALARQQEEIEHPAVEVVLPYVTRETEYFLLLNPFSEKNCKG
ncbi:hypothetical protein Riv7116_0575 [Rivularia sp. PCC 7116]|nr:hypothetical protein [Rivularia sp. PCC 7116]AFY53169.1 hypothetical protein Riv7116_0575 [Rivularia sp. PCC 7116]